MCKRIIESHNGLLNVESTLGQGTTISIEFPLEEEATIQSMELIS